MEYERFRQILRNLIVDQSTPDMNQIIQRWWIDCPPQGKAESAASFARRVVQLRNKFNHFANLHNDNPANCLLFMGSPPIDNPRYTPPPASVNGVAPPDHRSDIQKYNGLVAAEDGLDWAPNPGDMLGVKLAEITDRETIQHIYNLSRRPADLTTILSLNTTISLVEFTALFKTMDDLNYKSNEGKQHNKRHKSNTMVAAVSRGRGNKGGRGRGGKGKGRGGKNATGTGICFYYQKHGNCKYGDKCKFSHQTGGTTDGATPTTDPVTKDWVLANRAKVMAMYDEEEAESNGDTFYIGYIHSVY